MPAKLQDYLKSELGRVEMVQIIVLRKDLDGIIPKGKRLALIAHLATFNIFLQLQNTLNTSFIAEYFRLPYKLILAVQDLEDLQQLFEKTKKAQVFGCLLEFNKQDIGVYDLVYKKVSNNLYAATKYSAVGQSWKQIPDEAFTTVGASFGPIPRTLADGIFKKYPLYEL